jgi:hypothetical protein
MKFVQAVLTEGEWKAFRVWLMDNGKTASEAIREWVGENCGTRMSPKVESPKRQKIAKVEVEEEWPPAEPEEAPVPKPVLTAVTNPLTSGRPVITKSTPMVSAYSSVGKPSVADQLMGKVKG